MKAIVNALTPQQWKLIGAMLLGTTGPIAWLLSRYFGLSDADVKTWLDFIAAITPIAAGIFVTASKSDANMVKDAGTVPGAQVHVDTAVAPPAVVDAALDRAVKDVVPMVGGRRDDAGKLG